MSKPKVGIALSGASGRAMAHIAVLEVLKKHNIPVDIIVGCSSGALIAASYAVGTLEKLKTWFSQLTTSQLFRFWSVRHAHGGLFHLNTENADQKLDEITENKSFEEIQGIKLGMVATDLDSGELVTLTKGSLNEAFKASVAVPGLLEPVILDGRILVDGGLVNIVPTQAVKDLGADIVIGVNASGAKFIYEKRMPFWRGYKFVKKVLGIELLREKILSKLSPRVLFGLGRDTELVDSEHPNIPSIMKVMSKAVEHSFRVANEWDDSQVACDLMIETGVKHYGKTEFKNINEIYKEGAQAAENAVAQIQKLIENFGR